MKYFGLIIVVFLVSFGCSNKNEGNSVVTKEVSYSADGTTLKGFLAYDESQKDVRPGVLVVHEWWGHNAYARKRAKMLAELGYVALAVDMYGDGKQAGHPDDAGKFAMAVMQNMSSAKARFNAGLNFLKDQPQTDKSKIGAIGYCFGGGIVLRMAVGGEDLKGVVSFHGSLPTDSVENPKQVKAKLLICNGEADGFVPSEQIDAFKKAMTDAGINYKFINYHAAIHAFTNPDADSLGKKFNLAIAYNKKADEESWKDMKLFLTEIFK
ncbi:MAG: dienelactone hydrolase family protein [Ignavibacteriaceae bacterium]|nr:dienelactone hydrolase family protein [Ignavibacteriaceae bacterium]